jgi:CBS domain-containing protein
MQTSTIKTAQQVRDIMTSLVETVSVHSSLAEVNALMVRKSIRHVPVIDGTALIGIISRTDIDRLSFSGLFGEEEGEESVFDLLALDQVMRHNPRSVKEDDDLQTVAAIFVNEEFHALPVVDNDNNIKGIITTTDMMRLFL